MLRHNVLLTVTEVSEEPDASTCSGKALDCLTLPMRYHSFRKSWELFTSWHGV